MLQAGIDFMKMNTILITHSHTDHVYGLPILMHEMMLRGAPKSLGIFCPEPALKTINTLLDCYFGKEPWFPCINVSPVKLERSILVTATDDYEVLSTPVDHGIPTVAYKIVDRGGKALVYAPDTRPCPELVEFAAGVDLLFHDCSYADGHEEAAEASGHSTPSQAAKVASLAKAKKLVLIHLGIDTEGKISSNSARQEFGGEVIVGCDLLTFEV
jgi:ribonuclease Z